MRAWPTELFAAVFMSTPMRGIRPGCCARAAIGHAAAAPPRTPKKSRRLMLAPRLRRRHRSGSNECIDRGVRDHNMRLANVRCGLLAQPVDATPELDSCWD